MAWGVEIQAGRIRLCQAVHRGGRIRVAVRREVELAAGAIQPSLKESNLKDPGAVQGPLRDACRQLNCRGWVGVALPDAALSLRGLVTEAVPPAPADAQRFLAWQARDLLPFPVDEARVDFLPPQAAPDGRLRVICLFARARVIREYESLLEAAGLQAAVVDARSVCLALAGGLAGSGDGIAGLLSLQDDHSTFLVLENGQPRFWRILSYGRAEWGGESGRKALRELADSIAYCEESEGIGRLRDLAVEGSGDRKRDVLPTLEGWLSLPARPLDLGPRGEAGDAEGLEPWGAAIGAAIRPW